MAQATSSRVKATESRDPCARGRMRGGRTRESAIPSPTTAAAIQKNIPESSGDRMSRGGRGDQRHPGEEQRRGEQGPPDQEGEPAGGGAHPAASGAGEGPISRSRARAARSRVGSSKGRPTSWSPIGSIDSG